VPIVEAVVIARSHRPDVPGPHVLDGVILGRLPGVPLLEIDRELDLVLDDEVIAEIEAEIEAAVDPLIDTALPADGHVPMVFLGDSLASGVGAETADAAFPRRAAALFGDHHGRSIDLTCLASPGARAADVLALQVPDALPRLGPGSIAVVTVGSNDVGNLTRPRRFRREYAAIIDQLVATDATVIAMGLPDIGAAKVMAQPLRALAGWVGHNADRAVRRIAERAGAHYVGIDVSPPAGTAAHVYLAADRWHPNNDTYRLWADRLARTLGGLQGAHPT
jgi:lysophospholipase L1-like esterase